MYLSFADRVAMTALSLALVACGSESGGLVSTPPAAGNPPPSGPIVVPDNNSGIFTAGATGGKDRIIGAVGASQYFTDGVEEISIGYDSRRDQYFLTTNYDTDPDPLGRDPNYMPLPGAAWQNFVSENGTWFGIQATADNPDQAFRYTYSNLAYWSDVFAQRRGTVAFGMRTNVNDVPTTGTASYHGFMIGGSTEKCSCGWDGKEANMGISGSVDITADFASASLSGTVSPRLESTSLGELTLENSRQTGSRTGTSADLNGAGFENGRLWSAFTGPAAEEMIGGLSFDYVSPFDGSSQSGEASFIAQRQAGN